MMRSRLTLSGIVLREIRGAKLNTALCFVTVLLATGVLVAIISLTRASVDATRVLMRDMGFNLLITPEGVDPARFQALDFQNEVMPEEYVGRLASSTALAQHFVGKLQKTIQIDGVTVVLTGVLPEIPKSGTEKKPMPTAYAVSEGNVLVRSVAARALNLKPGDTLNILGTDFAVDKVLDDLTVMPEGIRVFAHLHDVQKLLGLPGKVNAIDALACYCPVETKDLLGALEKSVKEVLPGVNVEPYQSILLARHEQRMMVYRLEVVAIIIVVVGSATTIWGLTHVNVRNRRREIGVFRALGVSDAKIVAIFANKILLYSIAGAVLGCVAGYLAALGMNITGRPILLPSDMAVALIVGAPAAAVLFGLPPILTGLLQEPTEVLKEGA